MGLGPGKECECLGKNNAKKAKIKHRRVGPRCFRPHSSATVVVCMFAVFDGEILHTHILTKVG